MNNSSKQKLMIIGLGNAGINIIKTLDQLNLAPEIELVAIDTDKATLDTCDISNKLLANSGWTDGVGCGGDTMRGQRALSRERRYIGELIKKASLIIVTGGLGGGTATGGAPILSSIINKEKIPVIFMMTMPFAFEGYSKSRTAKSGAEELLPTADVLLLLPNDLLFASIDSSVPATEAFTAADTEMSKTILGLSNAIRSQKLLSIDLPSLRFALHNKKSTCCLGTGSATVSDGLNHYHMALQRMLESAFLGGPEQLKSADLVILIVTAGIELQMGEMKESFETAEKFIASKAQLMIGAHIDPTYKNTIQITAIAIHYDKSIKQPVNLVFENNHNKEMIEVDLPLESISKGIFDDRPTIFINGEDLDIPTFQRKNIKIDTGKPYFQR